jgi:lipopolysaccharide export system protein LptA
MRYFKKYMLLFFLLFIVGALFAQEGRRINIVQGGHVMEGVYRENERYDRLIGDASKRVIFSQNTTTIYCDSAYLYRDKNQVEAYGNVKIVEKDTITITGNKLIYFGNTKMARMLGNVVYKDPSLTIESEAMQYDMINDLASYYQRGKLYDDVNTLTSDIGTYHTVSKMASFKDDVVLVNPDHTLYSDTLQYNTVTKVAIIRGASTIVAKEDSSVFRFHEGLFNTTEEKSVFGKGHIETESYILEGDSLFSDDANRFYSASSNVKLIAKEENIVITGQLGRYWKDQGLTKISGSPIMMKIMETDTLFLAADTLVSIDSKVLEERRILAYHDVRIFKSDMQGIADSIAYHTSDSIIYFYMDPVLWYDVNQIEADSINMKIIDGGIDKMNLKVNAFLISQDTLLQNFNQIKGREMTINFKDNQIDHAYVFGNGESVMFAADEQENVLIGLNKVVCSSMTIRFKNSQFNNASFYTKPEASFIPPHEIKLPDKQLPGFKWRKNERPQKEDIFIKRDKKETEKGEEKLKIPGAVNLFPNKPVSQ